MLTARSCIRCSLTLLVTKSTSSEARGVSFTPARAVAPFSRTRWARQSARPVRRMKSHAGVCGLARVTLWKHARGPAGIVVNLIAFASTAKDMHELSDV